MLSTSSFYQLNYAQQADALLQQGLFLETRKEGNFIIDLYELHDLLVEIFYNNESEQPVSVMAYNALDKLKKLYPGKLQPRLRIKDNGDYRKGAYAA